MIQELFEHDVYMPKKIEIRLRSTKYANNVKAYEENKFSKNNDDDEVFVFGADFGSGTDADHFQLGLTFRTLFRFYS
jgi:hypothetical protein